jgi:phosphopantothenoylcysteine decarboxylase/phosphopantothenate--cysteine ligase
MATGQADNLLLAAYLSARCPVFAAPAMDLDMFRHPATQENISVLKNRGVHFVEPATGELASGLEGKGRMEEPEKIFFAVSNFLAEKKQGRKKKLSGKKVLITAGPTYEPIDPVRFIGNFSSGKMGYALAEAFAEAGAQVILVSGPVSLSLEHPAVEIIRVTTAREMYESCLAVFPRCHIAILSAAVADYTPANPSKNKLKRTRDSLSLRLKTNPDIAAELGKKKKPGQILAGFALETENGYANALQKLRKKNFDFIVLNSLQDQGAGFGTDTNKITILDNNNPPEEFSLKDKKDVARDILNKTLSFL